MSDNLDDMLKNPEFVEFLRGPSVLEHPDGTICTGDPKCDRPHERKYFEVHVGPPTGVESPGQKFARIALQRMTELGKKLR